MQAMAGRHSIAPATDAGDFAMTLPSSVKDDWSAISALLDQALDLPAAERAMWLDALGAEHARLKDTLRDLLSAAAEAETADFLQTLPHLTAPPVGDVLTDVAAGASIGPYRLISELGAGGMGAVWLAERADGSLKRKVALKLPRLMWGRGLAERMARERDILASLEHPHIARLYDAGVDQHGRPYLALEYVEGQPIDAYAKAHSLPVADKLRLLLQVASAVAFAHNRLVIHRDLKPSNILVTADGQARLLDFGIAKLMEGDSTKETQLTQIAGRALTLDYASPEQIKGESIGTASDVYSLGVVAYELLTGSKPYRLKRGSAAELEEAIATVDPDRPSKAAQDPLARRQLEGDLDAILGKALAKQQTDRYPTVAAFGEDIERHLRGQPVQARPDLALYRLGKFLRRNRLAASAVAAVFVAISAGAGVAIWQAIEARAQAHRANVANDQQGAVRELYVEAWSTVAARAGDDVKQLTAPNAVSKILRATLDEMAPRYRDRPDEWKEMLHAVMLQASFTTDHEGAIDVGKRYIDHMKQHGAEAWEPMYAHIVIGRSYAGLQRFDESVATLRAGLAWAPDDQSASTRKARMAVLSDLGDILGIIGQQREAERMLLQAEEIAQRDFPDDRDRFDNLRNLGLLYMGYDDAKSLAYLRQAFVGLEASQAQNRESQAHIRSYLGISLIFNGLLAEAEKVLQESHQLYIDAFGRAHPLTVRVMGFRSSAMARQGRYTDVRAFLQKEQAAMQSGDGAKPSDEALASVRGRRLENEWLYGDASAAAALIGSTADETRRIEGLLDRATVLRAETWALAQAGRAREAVQRAAAIAQDVPPFRRHAPTGVAMTLVVAETQIAAGNYAAARQALVDEIKSMREQGATVTWNYRLAVELAAVAATFSGDGATAASELTAVENEIARLPAPSPVEEAESSLRRAQVLQAAGRKPESVAAARKALELLAGQSPASPRVVEARNLAAL
jgi:serine/threonine-protein kinase